ncbi:M28 family metallopeptidase [Maricaulis sp.]|jgi:Zn-dependent M28 family amino/carboxypeptidase|uniref:M28 family metallopeptidase n=1 Tax=Maricaulis sp. TaxID=1486257 RepID=UPI00261FB100|nr:M28 family metallopeptidase [Maricaulis sp.]MDF1770151.1 M28 family metallopeptidase [Maricaulis sp.]
MKHTGFPAALIGLAVAACSPSVDTGTDTMADTATDTAASHTESMTSAAINEADLRHRIATLADDSFEGRAPATPGGIAASQWIADEMARIGLEPGYEGSYFQPVSLLAVSLDADASSFDVSFEGEPLGLSMGEDIVYWSKLNASDITVEDSDLVFVGYGVVAPEYGWDDYADLDVEGRTVVMLVNDPGYANPDSGLFNGNAMTYYGRWTYKYEEAARQGAAAVILIHQTAPASYGWNVVSGSWSGTQLDLAREPGEGQFANVESWVTEDRARQMFDLAGLDFDALTASASQPGFTPVEMSGLSASGQLANSAETMDSRNVVGVVPGTTRPDEYILYTAHWDHIGIRDVPEGEDGLYNGAVDNATGTAAILEIGEAFAANPGERSVMILAVTAEESGLLGSAYYGENPIVPFDQTVGGLNIDAILPTGRARDVVVVGHGASELEDLLTEAAAEQDRYIVPDPNPEAGYFYRSDHIELAKHGVPMLYADGGFDLREGGNAAGMAIGEDYRANRYHGPADEYSEDWNMEGMVEDTALFFTVGSRLANSDDWPNWYEGNEFRALRDAQMSD